MSQMGKKSLFGCYKSEVLIFLILQFAGGEYTYIYSNI